MWLKPKNLSLFSLSVSVGEILILSASYSSTHQGNIFVNSLNKCIGVAWQSLVATGARGVFCEKLPEGSLCPTEPIPAGWKTDPLLAKAEPIRDGGSSSGIRKGNSAVQRQQREDWGDERAAALQAPRSVKQERGGGAHPEIPLQPMEVHGGAEILLQPVEEPTPEQVGAPKEGCNPLGLFLVYFCISSLGINDIP